ncbi:MAG: metallophosphoesterase family protein [Phycisphaerae bacterium]|nr:metallophosphoesterase family protein [Phycisphaerae bacterium]
MSFDVLTGRPTLSSVTFNIVSPLAGRGLVEYGPDPVHPDQRSDPKPLEGGTPGEIVLQGLTSATRYYYRVRPAAERSNSGVAGTTGTFCTQRRPGESFVFTLTTDSHLLAGRPRPEGSAFARAMARVPAEQPDFHITLGDEAMTHAPLHPTHAHDQPSADAAYLNFRQNYAAVARCAPLFFALGNHDGEGWIDEDHDHSRILAEYSRTARTRYVPNPHQETYPQGGGPHDNYYAWTWGDALFVVLDPFTYSSTGPKAPEDWTLGAQQLAWLEQVLKTATRKWKLLFQHQLVGGSPWNSVRPGRQPFPNYGRGGATFANGGEQKTIHQLMKQYGGQIIFKGHDHVFADETYDGIRYTTCGRLAGEKRPSGPTWAALPRFRELYPGGYDGVWGYIRVAVTPMSVEVKYISVDGEERGSYLVGSSG